MEEMDPFYNCGTKLLNIKYNKKCEKENQNILKGLSIFV